MACKSGGPDGLPFVGGARIENSTVVVSNSVARYALWHCSSGGRLGPEDAGQSAQIRIRAAQAVGAKCAPGHRPPSGDES